MLLTTQYSVSLCTLMLAFLSGKMGSISPNNRISSWTRLGDFRSQTQKSWILPGIGLECHIGVTWRKLSGSNMVINWNWKNNPYSRSKRPFYFDIIRQRPHQQQQQKITSHWNVYPSHNPNKAMNFYPWSWLSFLTELWSWLTKMPTI